MPNNIGHLTATETDFPPDPPISRTPIGGRDCVGNGATSLTPVAVSRSQSHTLEMGMNAAKVLVFGSETVPRLWLVQNLGRIGAVSITKKRKGKPDSECAKLADEIAEIAHWVAGNAGTKAMALERRRAKLSRALQVLHALPANYEDRPPLDDCAQRVRYGDMLFMARRRMATA